MDYHKDQATQLSRLAASGDLPHLLFYGPSGAGKKTRVMALLRAIFGAGVEKVKLEHRTFSAPSGKAIEVTTVASNYHIEVNPGDAGMYDRYVVQELIKEMAAYAPLTAVEGKAFKVVLLSEVDRLSKEAQAALRRTMEKYSASCRLILVASSPSKVIEPVRSRCLGIRVPAPTQQEIMAVLTATCTKEGLVLPLPVAAKVAAQSSRNLRRALLMLEAAKVQGYPFNPAAPVAQMDWERYCVMLAADILREQSPRQLLVCRGKVYDLLVNCIPADVLIKRTLAGLLEKLVGGAAHEGIKHELARWAAVYEHRLQMGNKELFHIEAFIVRSPSPFCVCLLALISVLPSLKSLTRTPSPHTHTPFSGARHGNAKNAAVGARGRGRRGRRSELNCHFLCCYSTLVPYF